MIGARLHHRGFEPEDVTAIIEAHDWMNGLAERSCDCDWNGEDSQLHNPCDSCQARRALDALAKVIDPKPITLHPGRLTGEAERIYYELWEKENERKRWLNSGFTLIEHLLCPEGQKRPTVVSQHDMTIATTVIQWLGTTCGKCFINEAEREIEKRRAERTKFGTNGGMASPEAWAARTSQGPEFQVADSIAATFVSTVRNPSVYTSLRSAIINAIVAFQKKSGTTQP